MKIDGHKMNFNPKLLFFFFFICFPLLTFMKTKKIRRSNDSIISNCFVALLSKQTTCSFVFLETNYGLQLDNIFLAEKIHNKPGQAFKLHFLVSMVTPSQGLPPFAGAGFVQLRMRF